MLHKKKMLLTPIFTVSVIHDMTEKRDILTIYVLCCLEQLIVPIRQNNRTATVNFYTLMRWPK